MTPREMWQRLTAWRQRTTLSRDLKEELQEHLELLTRDFERDGMPRADALAAARRQLGNITALNERSREYWGFPRLEAVLQDLRYVLRGLVRSPGFSVTVIVTLGLGIGANAAIFAVIDRLMFRPFPFMTDPGSVNGLYLQFTSSGRRLTTSTIPYTRYLDLKRETQSFQQYAAVSEWRVAVGTGQDTRVRKLAGVSASLFDFFDAAPVRGRYFHTSEDTLPRGAMVAVVSESYWRAELGGRDVLGHELQVGSLRYTIIGIAPAGFVGVASGRAPEVFVPITTIPENIDPSNRHTYFTQYNWDWVEVVLRRRPRISESVASADLSNAYRRSRAVQRATNPRVLPDSLAQPAGIAGPLRDAAGPNPGLESRVLLWVGGVAVVVLLIACANVANLMLTRFMRRRREVALRLALGVRRTRLLGQFIVEGLLLSVTGGVAALLVAQWGGVAIRSLLLPEGSSFDLSRDMRTIVLAGFCALVAALLTVIAPAVAAMRSDLARMLKSGPREGVSHSSRLRSALLVMQAALSVALLVGAGLFVRSLNNAINSPLGFDARQVLELYLDFRGQPMDSAASATERRRLFAAAEAIPGVESATRVNSGIFRTNTAKLHVPGVDSVERLGRFNFQLTTAGYFRVMRTRIVRGRGFDERDAEGSPLVTVVSEAMANVLWPGQDALGQCIRVNWNSVSDERDLPCITVIGVAENAAHQSIRDAERFMYYLNMDQLEPSWIATFLVRMQPGNLEGDIDRVRRAMQAAMPGMGFVVVRPLQEVVDDQRRSWQLGATLFVAFGSLALIVAAVGLYGVMGYNVAQRMHEMGVRVALGARSGSLVRLVVYDGLTLAMIGVTIGLSLAMVASRWMQPLLYEASARDPVTYGGVALVMAVVAIAACAVPALRAGRADPNTALRSD